MNTANLTLSDVSQEKWVLVQNGFKISFSIDECQYRLYAEESNGLMRPTIVIHDDEEMECPYCQRNVLVCPVLGDHKQELFYRLIQFPSIRLEWLYINHI